MISRIEQRRTARAARAQISNSQRSAAAALLAKHLFASRRLRPGQRIACYLPTGSELDTRPLIRRLLTYGCLVYLPRIESWRGRRMRFIAIDSGPLRQNRYGLQEPTGQRAVNARWMQVVLLPLVAFDTRGNRLGSGAGFYDRALAFRRQRRHWRGPLLVGLAFAAQETEDIVAGARDVPLDALITEHGWRFF